MAQPYKSWGTCLCKVECCAFRKYVGRGWIERGGRGWFKGVEIKSDYTNNSPDTNFNQKNCTRFNFWFQTTLLDSISSNKKKNRWIPFMIPKNLNWFCLRFNKYMAGLKFGFWKSFKNSNDLYRIQFWIKKKHWLCFLKLKHYAWFWWYSIFDSKKTWWILFWI